jgi:hypothetical protein
MDRRLAVVGLNDLTAIFVFLFNAGAGRGEAPPAVHR